MKRHIVILELDLTDGQNPGEWNWVDLLDVHPTEQVTLVKSVEVHGTLVMPRPDWIVSDDPEPMQRPMFETVRSMVYDSKTDTLT